MTLLTSVFAAIICTIIWYKNAPKNEMKIGILCRMYWGASLMWLVDAIFEYAELKTEYFTPEPADMLKRPFPRLFRCRTWFDYLAGNSSDQRSERCNKGYSF